MADELMGPIESFVNEVAIGAYKPEELAEKARLALQRHSASPQPAPHAMTRITESEARTLREGMQRFAVQETKNRARDLIDLLAQPAAVEPARPDILEKLTYHKYEMDDLTLDEALSFLAVGWQKVRGRTERELVFQIVSLMAAAPSPAVAAPASAYQAFLDTPLSELLVPGYDVPEITAGMMAEPDCKAIDAQGAEDGARECLRDVVSHYDDFVKACELRRDVSEGTDDESYWTKQVDVLGRMKKQAERALASPIPAATLGKAEDAACQEWAEKYFRNAEEFTYTDFQIALAAWKARAALAQQPAASDVRDAKHIGVMEEGGVRWFGANPHGHSVGTNFYASQSTPAVHAGKGNAS